MKDFLAHLNSMSVEKQEVEEWNQSRAEKSKWIRSLYGLGLDRFMIL